MGVVRVFPPFVVAVKVASDYDMGIVGNDVVRE